jgi:hypothetical protein
MILKTNRMKEFVLLFRMDITSPEAQPSPRQMELDMVDWMEWIDYITDKGQLAEGGNHLSYSGKVIQPFNGIIEGPYTVKKESVTSYIIILAKDIDDAVHIAKKCPILQNEGNSIEIRETVTPWTMRTTKRTSKF